MKTKLTLTVHKRIIDRAKRIAKERNMSLSSLFEEVFEEEKMNKILSPKEEAMKNFKSLLKKRKAIDNNNDDNQAIAEYVNKKYA